MVLTIYFDGGCRPTNPGNKYGSYQVLLNGQEFCCGQRVEFGKGTNNEAEFNALNLALEHAMDELVLRAIKLGEVEVGMWTDSMIVANRISGRFASTATPRAKAMHVHAVACLMLLQKFKSYDIKWNPRKKNLERFGH